MSVRLHGTRALAWVTAVCALFGGVAVGATVNSTQDDAATSERIARAACDANRGLSDVMTDVLQGFRAGQQADGSLTPATADAYDAALARIERNKCDPGRKTRR